MKTTVLILTLFCSAAAFGQAQASISAQPAPAQFADHPIHAEPHSMATQTPIAGGAADAYAYEKGEQPLWQFGPFKQEVSLGDVARSYRKQKQDIKKAEVVLDKQGS